MRTPRLLVSLDPGARCVRVQALAADGSEVWTAAINACELHRYEVPEGGRLVLADDVIESNGETPA